MVDVLRIKRRSSGNPGAPTSLAYAELAYNEVDDILYYGRGNNAGQAVTIIPIAGPGFVPSGGGSSISVGDTAPASPTDNSLWWETDSGILWLRYNDGNSTSWIAVSTPYTPPIGQFLPLTGGSLSGTLTIAPAGNSALYLRKAAVGNSNFIEGSVAGVRHWSVVLGAGTAADDFIISRYDDSGFFVDSPIRITRSSGDATFSNNIAMGGALTLVAFTGDASIDLRKPAATNFNTIYGRRVASARWCIIPGDGTAESGSNLGSNFQIQRYNDAGTIIDTPLTINRATGVVTFAKSIGLASIPYMPSDTIDGTIFTSGNVTFTGGGITQNVYYHTGSGWKYLANGYGSILAASGSGGWDFYGIPAGSQGNAATIIRNISIGFWNGTINPIGPWSCTLNIGYSGGGNQYGIGLRCAIDTTQAIGFANAANSPVGSISVTAAATTFNTSSDGSLKEDLQSFDAGSIIDNLKVYDFAWKTTGERAHGIIAQEAIEVYPEAVVHVDDGQMDWWGTDYSKYVPLLLQEIKALRERVSALEGR